MNNRLRSSLLYFVAVGAIFVARGAFAHSGAGLSHDLAHGLMHPLTGLDHLLAMVAVGLWAAQRGGASLWSMPLTFVVMLTVGAALGMAEAPLPLVEPGIIISVLVLGVVVAAAVKLPFPACLAIVGAFAVVHGYAHGVEIPGSVSGFGYAAGFVAATAAMHAAGILIATADARLRGPRLALTRFAGGAIAVGGIWLGLAA